MPNRAIQLAITILAGLASIPGCAGPWPWRKAPEPMTVARPPTQPPYESPATTMAAERNPQTSLDAARLAQSPPGGATGATPDIQQVRSSTPLPAERTPVAGVPTYPVSASGGPGPVEPVPGGTPTQPTGTANAGAPPSSSFEPAKTVAIVGNQYVLAGEVEGTVNLVMATVLPPDTPVEKIVHPEGELAAQKEVLFRQQLIGDVQAKIGYVDFLREVPPDRVADLQKKINEAFVKDLESVREKLAKGKEEDLEELRRREMVLLRLAIAMKQHNMETLADLDRFLHRYGTSLERQQRAYGEQKLSQMAVMRNIRHNAEITHEEMLEYYREHHEEYFVPAKARWEELMVRFDKFPTRKQAAEAIAAMGNEVYLGGAPLPAVAKRSSHGPTSEQGGQFDWTNRGSLASKPLDSAIFSLPLNRLSEIIEDDRGYHIVRVLERTEDTYTSFVDAQVEIKDKIRVEKRMADYQAYLEKMRENTRVWTIYDQENASQSDNSTTP